MEGAYFVTICAQGRACLFGEVVGDKMRINEAGTMIETVWRELPRRFSRIDVDSAIVMPNHFHGIVLVGAPLVGALGVGQMDRDRATTRVAPTGLGAVIGAFKSITTNAYIRGVGHSGWCSFERRLWQRGYYEHIIRNDASLNRIRWYIAGKGRRRNNYAAQGGPTTRQTRVGSEVAFT
jgi:REP element-mobilizing transposase RayT